MCPECGHGSPELRDERAHLDAHRQLQAFFREWDAGTAPEPVDVGRTRRRKLVVAVILVLVLLASVGVFAKINRTPDAFRATVPARTAPVDDPARQSQAARPAQPVAGTVAPPAAPAQSARPVTPAPPSASVPAPVLDLEIPVPVSVPSTGGLSPPVAAPAPGPASVPEVTPNAPPPPHLLSLCILGICLDVL